MENSIESLVVDGAGQQFDAKDFRALLAPGVYVLMLGRDCLYVGMSNRLLGRIGSKHHKQIVMDERDRVLLFPTVSVEAAAELEDILIARLNPIFNISKRRKLLNKRLGNNASNASIEYELVKT